MFGTCHRNKTSQNIMEIDSPVTMHYLIINRFNFGFATNPVERGRNIFSVVALFSFLLFWDVFFFFDTFLLHVTNSPQIFHASRSLCSSKWHQSCPDFPQLQSRPVLFSSFFTLFEARRWQHKAVIYSEVVGRRVPRRAVTLTSNCRQTQPGDEDHKSVSDEPRHLQLICIQPPCRAIIGKHLVWCWDGGGGGGWEMGGGGGGWVSETLTRRRCSVSEIRSDALGVHFASSFC